MSNLDTGRNYQEEVRIEKDTPCDAIGCDVTMKPGHQGARRYYRNGVLQPKIYCGKAHDKTGQKKYQEQVVPERGARCAKKDCLALLLPGEVHRYAVRTGKWYCRDFMNHKNAPGTVTVQSAGTIGSMPVTSDPLQLVLQKLDEIHADVKALKRQVFLRRR